MLSVDHSNIDSLPLAVKCVRKFWSLVEKLRLCVCVCVYTDTMCQEWTLCMFYTSEVRTFDQERTHLRSAVGFNLRFGLVTIENPGIDHKIMGVA